MKKKLPLYNFAPWSPSKAELAAKCGLAFKYRYIDKIKGAEPNLVTKTGTIVHRAQELHLKGDNVEDAMYQALLEAKNLTHEEEENARTFAHSVGVFKEKLDSFALAHPVKEYLFEAQWAITADFKPCEFFSEDAMIRGVVDCGLVLESGHIIIIDHKTGRPRNIDNYGTQLDVYSIMAHAHVPAAKGVQCAIHFVAEEEIKWGKPKSSKMITEILQPWLTNYLNDRATRAASFDARMGRHCSWCDFNSICPEINKVNVQANEDDKPNTGGTS